MDNRPVITTTLSDWLQQRLDRDAAAPTYRQLHALLRRAVLEGQLPSGTRLPSSRLLAAELGIARNTVIEVYEQLAVEGCVHGHSGSGTFVADLSAERLVGRGAVAVGSEASEEPTDGVGVARTVPRRKRRECSA